MLWQGRWRRENFLNVILNMEKKKYHKKKLQEKKKRERSSVDATRMAKASVTAMIEINTKRKHGEAKSELNSSTLTRTSAESIGILGRI